MRIKATDKFLALLPGLPARKFALNGPDVRALRAGESIDIDEPLAGPMITSGVAVQAGDGVSAQVTFEAHKSNKERK